MGIIASQVYKEMHQALRGPGSASLSMQDVANDMGEFLCSMRSWKWKEGRQKYFDLRGKMSSATCQWDLSTLELSPKTGTDAFVDYDYLIGDRVLINSGTGLKTGQVSDEMAGRRVLITGWVASSALAPNNAALVLSEDISEAGGDLTTGDIDVEVRLDTFAVDEDIKEIIDIEVTDGLFNGITLTTKRELLKKRTSALETTSPWEYYVVFDWPEDTNGIPQPVGEVWPTPNDDTPQAFMGICKLGWAYITGETSVIRLPTWLYRLYKNMCREAWVGLHNHEGVGFDARMEVVTQTSTYQIARQRDASFQVEQGPLTNGHGSGVGREHYLSLFNNDALMGGPS